MNNELWTCVIKDIINKSQHIPSAILLGVVFFFVMKLFRRKKNVGREQDFLLWLACCYCAIFLYLTLLEREAGSRQAVSLKLFETFGNAQSNAYVVENVLLFIPFGFLGTHFWKRLRNPVLILITGATCSFLIEVTQLVTQRGYFQVDDLVMNSLGSGIGCLLWLFFRGFAGMIRKFRGENRSQDK